VLKEERESSGSLPRRAGLHTHGGGGGGRVRPAPKPLEHVRKDLEVVDARGEDASQTEKDLVTIGRVDNT